MYCPGEVEMHDNEPNEGEYDPGACRETLLLSHLMHRNQAVL